MRKSGVFAFLALVSCVFAPTAGASTLTGMVVFGDSLSDTGNTTQMITNVFGFGGAGSGLPPTELPYAPNYDTGRLTNGPNTSPASTTKGVWVEQLAPKIGLPTPTYSLSGGTNYAYAGAVTGGGFGFSGLVANMGTQLGMFCGGCASVSPHNLYVFWGGADDILTALGVTDPIAAAHSAATNLAGYIGALAAAGATDFLWADLPPLGAIPEIAALGPAASAAATAAALAFNADWSADIGLLQAAHPGVHIAGMDTFGLFAAIAGNPAAFGFTNITAPSANFLNGNLNVNPDNYLFWDLQHPTTHGHALLADVAAAAVPEPATVTLAAAGIAGLLLASRRRRGRRA